MGDFNVCWEVGEGSVSAVEEAMKKYMPEYSREIKKYFEQERQKQASIAIAYTVSTDDGSTDETEYKAGDIVLVRNDLCVGSEYGGMFTFEGMEPLFGKAAKLKKAWNNARCRTYQLDGYGNAYWTDEMLVGKIVPIKSGEVLMAGDEVYVREDLKEGELVPCGVNAYMEKLTKAGTILTISENGKKGQIAYDVKENRWTWSLPMLKGKLKRIGVGIELKKNQGQKPIELPW